MNDGNDAVRCWLLHIEKKIEKENSLVQLH